MAEVAHEVEGRDKAGIGRKDVEQHQVLLIVGYVLASEGVRPGVLGEDLDLGVGDVVGQLAEEAVEFAGEGGLEQLGAVIETRMGASERLAFWREVERIASGAEGVPAEVAVPVPVQVGAVDLVEGDAAAAGTAGGGGDLGVVEHGGYLFRQGQREEVGGSITESLASYPVPFPAIMA